MKRPFYILLLLPIFVQCKTEQTTQQTKPAKMNSYEYVDGNGNLYAISQTAIVYDPVTAEESSTGLYSGGEPYTAFIEEKQFNNLDETFKKCISDQEGQTDTRSKGTGTLEMLPSKKMYIFKMDSWQKKAIEDAIKLVTQK